jgi:transposase
MRPYSNDLREKIVRAYENGEGSQRTLARLFSVSEYFIRTLLKRWHESGCVAPKPQGGGRRPNLDQTARDHIRHLVASDPDATVAELCEQAKADCGQTSSSSAMCRLLQKLQLPRKKRLGTPQSVRANEYSRPEQSLSNGSKG